MNGVLGPQTDLLILGVLQSGPAHGYAIIEAIRKRSGGRFDLPEGTIYPVLHRLEERGLLRSYWTPGERRRRRTYELSGPGLEAAAERRREWSGFVAAVDAVIEAGA